MSTQPHPPSQARWTPAGNPARAPSQSRRRVQIYGILVALALFLLALTCGQLGVKAWQLSGPGSAWFSLLAAALMVIGGLALLVYSARSIRDTFKAMPRRAIRRRGESTGEAASQGQNRAP